ncbi:MAG: HvfB family MNIO-type RiPP peptide maturase [Rhodocyclaceae bacterium]
MPDTVLHGAGLGFRRELLPDLKAGVPPAIRFFELAPENWAGMGGRSAKELRHFTERFPFVCHGLSLDLGGPRPLDAELLLRIRDFMREHGMTLYTEHLSWCGDDGHLYDLLPIPCTGDAVRWVAGRIRQVQDILEMQIGIENASYYVAPPGAEMSETAFIRAVIEEADCLLHLDVNNVYVNSSNFGFDPLAFIDALPLERTCYLHMAGHYVEPDGIRVDTHGAAVIDPVWQLLDAIYARVGPQPTCLERDFNIPSLAELSAEVVQIAAAQQRAKRLRRAA